MHHKSTSFVRLTLSLLIILLLPSASSLKGQEDEGASTIRIGAYNIKHGRGMDGKVDLKRIAEVLKKLDLDLIALQEVDKNCKRSGDIDEAKWLAEELNMHHGFGHFMDFQGGKYGLAILSKFPIKSLLRHQLPRGAEPRCALEAIVQPPGCSLISFVSIHNDWTKEDIRVEQVESLLLKTKQQNHPVILAGDFNSTPKTKSMSLLSNAGFTNIKKTQQNFTFPSDQPKVEIDHILIRGFSIPGDTQCIVHKEMVASDHRPIYVELPTSAFAIEK